MRILIATAGSRGDVVPYTGLGVRLRGAGHRVAIATQDRLADLVTGSGLEFRSLPGDVRAFQESPAGRRLHRAGSGPRGVLDFVRLGTRFVRLLGPGLVSAARDADVLLLSTVTAPLGYSVAEAYGIASLGVFLQPVEPTAEFPPVVLGAARLTRWGNRAAGAAGERISHRAYAAASRRLRADLGLPPVPVGRLQRAAAAAGWPVQHGFSPTVVPGRPTGGRGWTWPATGGRRRCPAGNRRPTWPTSWPPGRRRCTSASAACWARPAYWTS
ncbi:glycosyltransferase [Plantactinospora sp. KBS50]|uniref:glycosyltransferase n=1 Tax=Plantactinospora sp. KBS50 TaxID=2024580 RepID=UPI001E3E90BD|nr:glycosyltransferase [Plantactinospora sp. KBS50]